MKHAFLQEQETVRLLIGTIHDALQEIFAVKAASPAREFLRGEIYAYVECLEILQLCPRFCALGIDYEVEKRFPLP